MIKDDIFIYVLYLSGGELKDVIFSSRVRMLVSGFTNLCVLRLEISYFAIITITNYSAARVALGI